MKLDHVAYFSPEYDKLFSFYREMLGVEPVESGPEHAFFSMDGYGVHLHVTKEEQKDWPPFEDHVGFLVGSIETAAAKLKGKGYETVRSPADYPWGRSGYYRDPDGRLVELAERS